MAPIPTPRAETFSQFSLNSDDHNNSLSSGTPTLADSRRSHKSPRRSRRPRGGTDGGSASGGGSVGRGGGLAAGGSLFMKLTALLLVVAVVDIIHVWRFIDDLGGDENDPQNPGAEAGLHIIMNLHDGKRRENILQQIFSKLGETASRGAEVAANAEAAVAELILNGNEEVESEDAPVEEISDENDRGMNERDVIPPHKMIDVEHSYGDTFGVDEHIVKILRAASVELDEELAAQLPTWDDVVSQYGPSPIIRGLETCEPYRQAVKPEDRMIGPAGLFNTGTNLLYQLLAENCHIKEAYAMRREPKRGGMRWQVPWGKHNPPSTHRGKNIAKAWGKGVNQLNFMPMVLIKDPYHWMGSQCRHKYTTFWAHDEEHCPNLIRWRIKNVDTPTDLNVKYALNVVKYETLLGAWNEWYSEYQEQTFPAIHTRFEDLLFHAEDVIKTACDCVGGDFTDNFKYVEESAKKGIGVHKGANGLVKAMLQYGDPKKRLQGFTDRDQWYASKHVRPDLMRMYGYSAPPLPT